MRAQHRACPLPLSAEATAVCEEISISRLETPTQIGLRMPAECPKSGYVEQFAWRAVRPGGVENKTAFLVDRLGPEPGQLADGTVLTGPAICNSGPLSNLKHQVPSTSHLTPTPTTP